jgi:hypothetical protein
MEVLAGEYEECSALVSKLRAENSDLTRASRDAIETREQFRQTAFELDRCRNEIKHMEEEMALLQVQRGREADKFIAMVCSLSPPLQRSLLVSVPLPIPSQTKNRDQLEVKLSTALAERDTEIHENLRVKANYEAVQKREVRMQTLLDTTRRELEDLQVSGSALPRLFLLCSSSSPTLHWPQMSSSELKAELTNIKGAHGQEIENMERMCDTLREEHQVRLFDFPLSLLLILTGYERVIGICSVPPHSGPSEPRGDGS